MSRKAALRLADKMLRQGYELHSVDEAAKIARIDALIAKPGTEWRAYLHSLEATLQFL